MCSRDVCCSCRLRGTERRGSRLVAWRRELCACGTCGVVLSPIWSLKTEHLVARTFFSLSLFLTITRTCVWHKASRLKFGTRCTSAHHKSHPLTTCFIDHSLTCLTHFLPFVSTPPPVDTDSTAYDWESGDPPAPLRAEDYSLAIW